MGRTSAEQFATAQRRIQETRDSGATRLDLSDLSKLTQLPLDVADLIALQSLNLRNTQVSDLAPLAALTSLQSLVLSFNQVSDLAPLAAGELTRPAPQ